MNFLYIDHYAGAPSLGMEYRPFYLAREWTRAGHRVTVLAAGFSHVRRRQPDLQGAIERCESIDGVDYRWIAAPRYRGNGVGRAANIAAFLARAWRRSAVLAMSPRPDAVIASSTYPMDIWLARRIARESRAALVFELHDLWPLSLVEISGMSPRHPFALICAAAERAACRDADLVVSMLPKARDHLQARGLDPGKLAIVPNGFSPDEWQGDAQPLRSDVAAAIARARADAAVVVVHAGSIGLPNALDTLLDAAALLQDAQWRSSGTPRIRILLVGDGHERERLVRRIANERLTIVEWLPPVEKAQVRSVLAVADIAYLGWQRVAIYRFGIAPNKLMDYMMAGVPVLHSVAAGNDPVADAGCGISCAPADARAVADGLRRLAELPASERRRLGERGRSYVQREHAYPVLAGRFLDAMMRATRSGTVR